MANLTKNAISVTLRDRVKLTKIWDHKGYKSEIRNIFKNSKSPLKFSKMSLRKLQQLNISSVTSLKGGT